MPVCFGTRLGVSLAAPKGVSKRMGIKMAGYLSFENLTLSCPFVLVPVFFCKLGASNQICTHVHETPQKTKRNMHKLAPPEGATFLLHFSKCFRPLLQSVKSILLPLRVATPSRTPRQAPLEDGSSSQFGFGSCVTLTNL